MSNAEKTRECICHASWSGYDEAEYQARGCPPCECWKIDAYDAVVKERDEAVEQMAQWYKANKPLCDVIKERDELSARGIRREVFDLVCEDRDKLEKERDELNEAIKLQNTILNGSRDALVKERDALRTANLSKQIFLDQIEKEARHERDALAAQLAEITKERDLYKQEWHLMQNTPGPLFEKCKRLEAQLAEANGLLPGKLAGMQALANEQCRCFLARIERLERALAEAYAVHGKDLTKLSDRESFGRISARSGFLAGYTSGVEKCHELQNEISLLQEWCRQTEQALKAKLEKARAALKYFEKHDFSEIMRLYARKALEEISE